MVRKLGWVSSALVSWTLFASSTVWGDYIAHDNHVPSPVYRSTNTQIFDSPSGPVVLSFFDVFTELSDRSSPPSPGATVDSFFIINWRAGLGGSLLTGPGRIHADFRGLTPGAPWDHQIEIEILQMELVGFPGAMVRESPTRPSLGLMSIRSLGGGDYYVDSFFDVFAEISFDNGQSWQTGQNGDGSIDEIGVPEPQSLALAAAGLAALGLLRRRGKSRRASRR